MKIKITANFALAEQVLTTGWNFLIGLFIAKYGGFEYFGMYSSMLSVYYLFAGPLNSATVSIAATDSPRLKRSRPIYLVCAGFAAERFSLVLAVVSIPLVSSFLIFSLSFNDGLILVLMSAYVLSLFFNDVWRRISTLNGRAVLTLKVVLIRLVVQGVFTLCLFCFFENYILFYFLLLCVVSMFFSVFLLRTAVEVGVPSLKGLLKIATGRQLKYGLWGFFSGLILTGFDQGVIVFFGISGNHDISAEVRSAGYLFGLLNPAMLVFDLLIPGFIFTSTRGVVFFRFFLVFCLGGIGSLLLVSLIIWLTKFHWLPYLGFGFSSSANLVYWIATAYFFMMLRSFLMPLIRLNGAKHMFYVSCLGTAVGFLIFFLLGANTANAFCQAMTASAFVLMLGCVVVVYIKRSLIFVK